jgi:hypothetical protein
MTSKPADPVYLKDIFPDVHGDGKYLYNGEFTVFAATEKSSNSNVEVSEGEILFWQMKGTTFVCEQWCAFNLHIIRLQCHQYHR